MEREAEEAGPEAGAETGKIGMRERGLDHQGSQLEIMMRGDAEDPPRTETGAAREGISGAQTCLQVTLTGVEEEMEVKTDWSKGHAEELGPGLAIERLNLKPRPSRRNF